MQTKTTLLKNKVVLLLALFLFFQSCATLISPYDHYAYVQTISVKVDALNLMDLATDSFHLHKKEIAAVQTAMKKIYEYEKFRPKNEITTKMWHTLKDTSRNLFGGFIVKWEKEKVVSKTYLENKKPQIATAFDQIIELESKKIKPSN